MNNIRNFSIIAHIDHGKSTLADRMLEITNTVEKRKMREQMLDDMELERERGITIKMQPVRMLWHPNRAERSEVQEYVLNLIDTPGHIDFSYEVSRALKAVEGSILLVDATQGVQAQTLSVLNMAKERGLVIVPVISKIDSPLARIDEVREQILKLLSCKKEDILEVSGKTGEGVENLLKEIIKKIPPPKKELDNPNIFRALIFDFEYSNHTGVIVFIRVFNGSVKKGDRLKFAVAKSRFGAIEVGHFSPKKIASENLSDGEIGYIVTGVKEPGIASVGDTISFDNDTHPALSGYMSPRPVVWASIFPESQDDFAQLQRSLLRLKLSDSSLTFEEESSGTLGRGFRCGFLGMLHMEIITERLKREFNINLIITSPSITYEVTLKNKETKMIHSAAFFPDDHLILSVKEPWISLTLITPNQFLGSILQALFDREAQVNDTQNFGENNSTIKADMPLRELMRNFFDTMKSLSSGFASVSYEILDLRDANVTRMDILVAEEPVLAFSRVVAKRAVEHEAENTVEKLYKILPRQMFTTKIQARALGRIISSRTLSALKKDVTQHMYGGDITRKMKLREKQKKGKKKMKERGRVNIPEQVFIKMMRSDS